LAIGAGDVFGICFRDVSGYQVLDSKDLEYDYKSATAAMLGNHLLRAWRPYPVRYSQFAWGSFWNWDPRETSITIVLLIYLAYFSLRAAVNDPVKKANLSAVYAILGFIAATFAIFIWPRITPGLHPGSPGGASSGKFITMSATTLAVIIPALAAFIILYGWIYSLTVRVYRLQKEEE
jgi:heme exporter protein C